MHLSKATLVMFKDMFCEPNEVSQSTRGRNLALSGRRAGTLAERGVCKHRASERAHDHRCLGLNGHTAGQHQLVVIKGTMLASHARAAGNGAPAADAKRSPTKRGAACRRLLQLRGRPSAQLQCAAGTPNLHRGGGLTGAGAAAGCLRPWFLDEWGDALWQCPELQLCQATQLQTRCAPQASRARARADSSAIDALRLSTSRPWIGGGGAAATPSTGPGSCNCRARPGH